MANSWGPAYEGRDLEAETTPSNLRLMDTRAQKELFFGALRAGDLKAIRNILQVDRSLLTDKMMGYECADVHEVIKNSKNKRCYAYTGLERDGFFYPLHVAAEAGHKLLVILLVKAGADVNAVDSRNNTAEDKCNGQALHGFYELKGYKFESSERYQGRIDRLGSRVGQGVIFFKPEGYLQVERQLFRGSFKNNAYHGHGTLYWPGTDVIRYTGRFKTGMRHGRGIEFDNNGAKVYQGTFRDDRREGRGEEFLDNIRNYKGEFSENAKHGFGVAYFDNNSKYIGRFENNTMSGVGIFCHPDGNRFEGMFFNNKPDGPGSFYERDPQTGHWTANHGIWQGRKIKDTTTPFIPTMADLPDNTSQ
eukprot:gene15838-21459_t